MKNFLVAMENLNLALYTTCMVNYIVCFLNFSTNFQSNFQMAAVSYVVIKKEDAEDDMGMEMGEAVDRLVVECGFMGCRVTELEEEVKMLKLMLWQLQKKRTVKRLKCRFC